MKIYPPAFCVLFLLATAAPSAGSWPPRAPNVVGLPILKARQVVMGAGWKPRPTFQLTGDDLSDPETTLESSKFQAGSLYRAGVVEVESCAWMGTVPCNFHYTNRNFCLRLVTDGESDDPVVVEVDDRCPDAESLKPPRNLNLLGRDFSEAKDLLSRIGWSLAAGMTEDCEKKGDEPCSARFEREGECQILETGADHENRKPGPVVLKQQEGCPAAPKK